jgi:hypothetical protein
LELAQGGNAILSGGCVRHEENVFYGAPASPRGTVRISASVAASRFELETSRVSNEGGRFAFALLLVGGLLVPVLRTLCTQVKDVAVTGPPEVDPIDV